MSLFFLGFASSGVDSLETGLIGYWKLDETSTGVGAVPRLDSSGNGLTLTDNNTTPSAAGVSAGTGNAASFALANTEFLSRASEAALETGDIDYTISLWLRLATNATFQAIISKDNITDLREYLLYYIPGGDRLSFDVFNGVATTIGTVVADTFGAVPLNTYIHVVVWHSATSNEVGIRINDVSEDTAATTGAAGASTAALNIGARDSAGSELHTDGRVDAVYFWKRLLTAAEKTRLYNGGAGLQI